jgi:hypothetical protein
METKTSEEYAAFIFRIEMQRWEYCEDIYAGCMESDQSDSQEGRGMTLSIHHAYIYPDCILTLFISTMKMEAPCSSRMLVPMM